MSGLHARIRGLDEKKEPVIVDHLFSAIGLAAEGQTVSLQDIVDRYQLVGKEVTDLQTLRDQYVAHNQGQQSVRQLNRLRYRNTAREASTLAQSAQFGFGAEQMWIDAINAEKGPGDGNVPDLVLSV